MEVDYLIDTNLFLEILLDQNKKEFCKNYLSEKVGHLYISDFSLHSIGVILFRFNKSPAFIKFLNDVLPKIEIVSLSKKNYSLVSEIALRFQLDFDDSYQAAISELYGFTIATMDNDFSKLPDEYKIDLIR